MGWNGPREVGQCQEEAGYPCGQNHAVFVKKRPVLHTQVTQILHPPRYPDRPSLVAVSQYFSDRPSELVMDLAFYAVISPYPPRIRTF